MQMFISLKFMNRTLASTNVNDVALQYVYLQLNFYARD
jgi:hypothetical protein